MTDSGVDIILGHHPHVLQPIEKVKTEDGREAVIVYSLGNFLSGQKEDYKDIGGMAVITVNKTIQDGRVTLSYPSVDFEPTYVSEQNHVRSVKSLTNMSSDRIKRRNPLL